VRSFAIERPALSFDLPSAAPPQMADFADDDFIPPLQDEFIPSLQGASESDSD
jgi:hypothetical protein